jgi:hypothetical protein
LTSSELIFISPRFRQGECWYFAATDSDQVTARGRYRPRSTLTVSERPVYSGEKATSRR